MAMTRFKLTGRSRMRRLWWAPWKKVEEFEIYMVFWSHGFFWYSRDQIRRYMPTTVYTALPPK